MATQEAFSADLAKAHAAVQAAEGRAGAAERRALLEIEQERQARAKSEKVAEGLRAKVGEAEAHERKLVAQHSETVTKLKIELNTATESSRNASATNERLQGEVDNLRLQLGDSQQARARHQAEAQTLQALIQRLTPTGSAQAGRPSRKKVAAA